MPRGRKPKKQEETETTENNVEESEPLTTSGGEKLVVHKTEDSEQIGKLYQYYQTISQAEDPEKCKKEFGEIIKAAKASPNLKKLAMQFIPEFFKQYETLEKKAISAMFDLIDEDDSSDDIRVGAIKGLGKMCGDVPKYVQQVTQFLGQLVTGQSSEIKRAAEDCISTIARLNVQAAVEGLFQIISDDESSESRKNSVLFFQNKIMKLNRKSIVGNEKLEEKIDETLTPHLKETENFQIYANVLMSLQKYQDAQGAQKFLDMLSLHGGFDELDEYDETILKNLLNARTYLHRVGIRGADVVPFYKYLVEKCLPKFSELTQEIQIDFLKTMAQLSEFVPSSTAKATIQTVYDLMLEYLPEKPAEGSETEPSLNFSFAECLLYTFHQLAPKSLSILNPMCGIQFGTGQPGEDMHNYSEKRKTLFDRLGYFKRKTQNFQTKISKPKYQKDASPEVMEAYNQAKIRYQLSQHLIENLIDLTSQLMKKRPLFVQPQQFSLSFGKKPRRFPTKKRKPETETQPRKRRRVSGRGRRSHN